MFVVNVIYPNRRALFHQTSVCSHDPATKLAGNISVKRGGESFMPVQKRYFPLDRKEKNTRRRKRPY